MKLFGKEINAKMIGITFLKMLLTIAILFISVYAALYILILGYDLNGIFVAMASLILPLLVTLVWTKKKRKKVFIIWLAYTIITLGACGINKAIVEYEDSLKIKTDININVFDYMPFEEDSKIVKLDEEATLKLENNLPRVDGAAAVFPLYSAFVNEVYPDSVEFREGIFEYNNTVGGYKLLGEKEIDIFFGAYPSREQIDTAKQKGTEFEYTEIGKEAFVFFVNKDNPVDNLTSEQIKDIYSGKITNWKDVGGNDEEILAFQRNEGSGSQSMLKRFMGDTPIMKAKTEQVNDLMSGIITQVADYKNYDNSIGFSFRYYLETLIANPNVKTLKVDGVAPTPETIANGTYGITASLYAVTYKDNPNENVKLLIDWILSEQGQELVEKTGYTKIK
ncbi:MAG: substrate-binding domain-containing protein [Clostridia bacterium]|nr:substrate-binding domain-containing protein [Clostridia bacterium]